MGNVKTLLHAAQAGFEEKNDLLVAVSPANSGTGIQVNLTSPVMLHFGEHIKKLVVETVQNEGFQDVVLDVKDKGAWDYTIKARIVSALERGMKND